MMELSESERLALYWMEKGAVMRWWRSSLNLDVDGLRFDKETKDELENKGLIRQDVRYLITDAGREALKEKEDGSLS